MEGGAHPHRDVCLAARDGLWRAEDGRARLRTVWRWRTVEAWHCNDIEAFVLGWFAQRLNPRLRLIYDCHEFGGERNAKPVIERKMVGWLERRTHPQGRGGHHGEPLPSQGLPGTLHRLWPSWRSTSFATSPSPSRPKPVPVRTTSAPGSTSKKAISLPLYQGAFTHNRGLETALEAMRGLEDSGIHLVLMGYGPLQPLVDAAAADLPHVHVHPAVAYEAVLEHTRSADVGLVSVKPTCLSYLYCLPNKLFEYLLAGVPVLSNDLPDCRALIEQFGAGSVVHDDTPKGGSRPWRPPERGHGTVPAGPEGGQGNAELAGRVGHLGAPVFPSPSPRCHRTFAA